MPTIANRLEQIEKHLATIADALSRTVPPADVRASMAESTEHIADATVHMVDAARSVPLRDAQISEIVQWMHARMSGQELEQQFDDLLFATQQLTSISEQWRTDLLQMRADIRRLAALCEQVLRARVDDEENGIVWSGEERRNSIADRRRPLRTEN